MNATQLLPAIRDLYSKRPEYSHHEPWEHAHILFSLGYVEDLAGERRSLRPAAVVRAQGCV
jgi:hypothetical protein